MINGFEEITEPLSKYELETILPQVINGLKTKRGKSNAITNREMCEGLYKHNVLTESGKRISEVTIRKIINYIRIYEKIECLIADGDGYYIEPLDDKVLEYIESLEQRISAIRSVQNALLRQVRRRIKQFNTINNNTVYENVQEKIFS